MKFKNTEYGDLTNQLIKKPINVKSKFLTSLEGCPLEIDDIFNCSYNLLTSLNFSPKSINGFFSCHHNKLESLEGSPKSINGSFYCNNNKLKSLKGAPKLITGEFNCENNYELKNVKEQIIENQIKARRYITDEGIFDFSKIKNEFEEFENKIKLMKQKEVIYDSPYMKPS